jgi:HSP20 family protein
MTTMIQWEPFNELRDTMDRLFDEGFSRPWRLLSPAENQAAFPVDIWETDDSVEVQAALPGVHPDDVNITAVGDTLTIGALRSAPEQTPRHYYVHELADGDWQRSFSLPTGVEAGQAAARFEHGMLYLTLPKSQAMRPKQIKITPDSNAHMITN